MNYRIEIGDCRDSLKRLAIEGLRAQTVVTSPPYFGLRDYGHDGQIGLEQTPEAYIAAMVDVFRCVWNVLADDGTLWLNIGDSYARTGGTDRKVPTSAMVGSTRNTMEQMSDRTSKASQMGLKHKDLIGIPWLLAFALRADGWHLRQDIIWHKPNPMPESVRDRCTKSHEYLFLLSKNDRYFYDAESIKEAAVKAPQRMQADAESARSRSVGPMARGSEGFNHQYAYPDRIWAADGKRNRRSVWTVSTRPYKGAHFATFPPALIEPCILAGSRPGDLVLDPFGGSGTTAGVAIAQGRRAVLCELNPAYAEMAPARIDSIVAAARRDPIKTRSRRVPANEEKSIFEQISFFP